MQVGVTVHGLENNAVFNRASYGFVIFSIVMVAALLAGVGTIFVCVFLHNMVAAISHAHNEEKRRKNLAKNRKKNV